MIRLHNHILGILTLSFIPVPFFLFFLFFYSHDISLLLRMVYFCPSLNPESFTMQSTLSPKRNRSGKRRLRALSTKCLAFCYWDRPVNFSSLLCANRFSLEIQVRKKGLRCCCRTCCWFFQRPFSTHRDSLQVSKRVYNT